MTAKKSTKKAGKRTNPQPGKFDRRALERTLNWSLELNDRQRVLLLSALEIILGKSTTTKESRVPKL